MLPQPQHKDVPPEQNHTPFAWIVADESERNALTVTADQAGKRLWQKSDDTEWTLKSADPIQWAIAAPVQSVHGRTGAVTAQTGDYNPAQVGAEPAGAAASAVQSHEQAENPHSQYVQKETGKGLSTEDYTTAEQSKLSAIEAGATKNATDAELRTRDTHTGTQPASTVTGLAPVATSGDYNALTNKPDLSALQEVTVYASQSAFPATGESNKIYIAENTGYVFRWNGNDYTQLTDQTAIWGQISGRLADQADLASALTGKVDKVAGKQLSSEDYTATEKTKLSGVEAGAQKNVAPTKADIDALNVDAATVAGKTVKTSVPAGAVFTDTVYDDSAIAGEVAGKVDKEPGKGLSTNDYTNADKSKLAGIEPNATADQTKADIDALNINADTVDGKHASNFDSAGSASSAVGSHESSASAHSASAITYDNSASNSPETKVQGAIDDIYDRIKAKPYGPGPQTLQAGDMTDGFFGEVTPEELFTGDELAAILAVTEGTAQNSDAGWLKFACDNKILFVAKKSFRHSISWDHIYSRGLVYGTDDNGENPRGTATNQLATVGVPGYTFKVRLLTGGSADPVDVSDSRFLTGDMVELDLGAGSEWNRLIYRVHQDLPTSDGTDGMRADRHGGPQVGENWASYTNSDLNITGGGRFSWCKETTTDSSAYRVLRGPDAVAHFSRVTASSTISRRGWRPALELITNH